MDLFLLTQDILLYPIRLAKSRTAQKAYLTSILFGFASLNLLCLAVIAYVLFYLHYVPQVGVEKIVYLHYSGGASGEIAAFESRGTTAHAHSQHEYPSGIAYLHDSIHNNQAYDISISLILPTSPPNVQIGNFMIDLELWTHVHSSNNPSKPIRNSLIARSSRPAILPYTSPLAHTIKTIAKAPMLLLGWSQEAEKVDVGLFENVSFQKNVGRSLDSKGGGGPQIGNGIPGMVKVKVMAKRIQVYEVKVRFRAKLSGIRYLMYNHRIISFILFTAIFWIVEMISATLVWYFILNSLTMPWSSSKKSGSTPFGARRSLGEGGVSDLDIDTDDKEQEGEGETTSTTGRGRSTRTRGERGYPTPSPTPETGLGRGAGIRTGTGTGAGDADDEDDDEEEEEEGGATGSESTAELVEHPDDDEVMGTGVGIVTDSGIGSSLSEGPGVTASTTTGRAGGSGYLGGGLPRKRFGSRS